MTTRDKRNTISDKTQWQQTRKWKNVLESLDNHLRAFYVDFTRIAKRIFLEDIKNSEPVHLMKRRPNFWP